jgi:hypothetical protein
MVAALSLRVGKLLLLFMVTVAVCCGSKKIPFKFVHVTEVIPEHVGSLFYVFVV